MFCFRHNSLLLQKLTNDSTRSSLKKSKGANIKKNVAELFSAEATTAKSSPKNKKEETKEVKEAKVEPTATLTSSLSNNNNNNNTHTIPFSIDRLSEQLTTLTKQTTQLSEQLFTLTQQYRQVERRLALLEECYRNEWKTDLSAVQQAVGALQLQSSNTEELMGQLESKVLLKKNNHHPSVNNNHNEEWEKKVKKECEEMIRTEMETFRQEMQKSKKEEITTDNNSDTNNNNNNHHHHVEGEIKLLKQDVESIMAKLSLYPLELFTAQRIVDQLPPQNNNINNNNDNGPSLLTAEQLSKLLRTSQYLPFRGVDGSTHVASQQVLVTGVPPTWGASEVLGLMNRTTDGGATNCVVRRQNNDHQNNHKFSEGKETPVFASKAHNNNNNHNGPAMPPPSTVYANNNNSNNNTRGFEVTFATSQCAVKAILELNNCEIKGNNNNNNSHYTLVVEPVVSVDIVNSIKALELERKREKKEK